MDKHIELMSRHFDITGAPMTAQLFGNAGIEHMKKYNTKPEHFAKIAQKNHKHSVNNPYAQFQEEYSLQQVQSSPQVHEFLTRLQCSPTSDGSAAAILASEDFVRRNRLESKAVEIVGMEMTTDPATTFSNNSMISAIGYDMTKLAADRLFAKTQHKPQDVDVIELHDCFSTNELITYEALGLCGVGQGGTLVDRGDNTYGGKFVINPSGGLISKGHPLGATGLAQCAELTWQLRGEAGKRQVQGAKLALQHNIGLGGAVVVGLYRLGFPNTKSTANKPTSNKTSNSSTNAANQFSPDGKGFAVTPYLRVLEIAMQEDQDNLIERVRGIYGFRVTHGPNGATGFWTINAKTGKGSVTYNGKEKPDVTFVMKDADVVELISGKLQPQKAFFQGKVKVQGNMGLAMKLIDLQKTAQSRIEELKAKL